ncbi:hypothetical protein KY325_04975 [Candidatus Woesearchaeota archaeon]|nr:hypothetical protein [Candidatus Woesearchaeota archaeon]MBW3018486.1 hypothetical protein [Candidatus Woesearchaeota archaeon]
MYEEQLKELGLTDNEVRIYLALIKHGMMNPYELSDKTGLHRGYIYDSLERLQEKGVVSSVLKANKKYFQATDPANLVEILRIKLETVEKIVPDLKKLMKIEKEDTKIELHKGRFVYRTIIKDILSILKQKQEVLLLGIDEDILSTEVEPLYLKRYLNFIKSKQIKERIIIKKGAKKVEHKNLQYKELAAEYIGNTTQIIYNSKVVIFIMGNPYHAITIENKQVADTYRKQFEFFWKIAEP